MTVDPVEVRRLIRLATARTGNPVYDEDLAQEAMLRALEAFRRVGEVAYPRAFLAKIVCDAVRDYWRRRRPAEDIASVDERFVSVQPNVDADIDRRRREALLRVALSTLTLSKRRVLRLFYEEDLSIPEIARLENSSVSAIKMQLTRTRQELASRIVVDGATKKSRQALL